MKRFLFNVIIPSIKIDNYLNNCLEKLQKQSYKNFYVTIILDQKGSLIKNYRFKVKKLITGKVNMSKKRNIGAKKYPCDYIAFLDSDAYPNSKWLENANIYYNSNKNHVIGGPNIPFPKETKSEILSHYCKRSFFINGHLAYRKYLSKDRYIDDWLESCNFFINRNSYLKISGMDEKIYIGEDQNFFKKLHNKYPLKIYFTKKLFVYHKDRNIINFLKQRFCFGLDVFNGVNFKNGLKGMMVLLPFLTLSILIVFFVSSFDFKLKLHTIFIFIFIFSLLVYLEVKDYVKKVPLFFVIFYIILANVIYGAAGFLTFIGLRNFIERKIYRRSR